MRSTNVEFVTELMDYSNNGPIMQAYVLEALRLYSDSVIALQDEMSDDGFISKKLWVSCATEVLRKLEERNNES